VAFAIAGGLYFWLPYRVAAVQFFFWLGGSRLMIPAEYHSLDSPDFVPMAEVDEYPPDAEVLGLELNGEAKAVPVKRLAWHLVVNDKIGGEPVTLTLCTVTGAAMAYRAACGEEVLEFAPARLDRNNLVLRDRQTGSSWQQFTGRATDGALAGTELERLPVSRVRLADWRQSHPAGVILKPLGSDRDCCEPNDECPVMSYFPSEPFLLQRPTHEDDRLPRKQLVTGIASTNGGAVAFLGTENARPAQQQPFLKVRCYWFAWVEFHPDTKLATSSEGIAVHHVELNNSPSGGR
jgi:hypothetical protein